MAIDYESVGTTVKPPKYLAHVVLQTNQLNTMVEFYKKFLNAHSSYENSYASFLTYDEEHHRIAIVEIPGVGKRIPKAAGLQHMAFAYETLEDLAASYLQRKANGIEPLW